jgi:ATP-dependent helicase/DNAse subunit B
VLAELRARPEYGGTTLEGFAVCSYRWFVDRELGPRRIDPDPEGLAEGSVIHRVLERLYRERPGGEARPRPSTVEAWIECGTRLVAEAADERGISAHDPVDRASRRRTERLLEAFLRREAAIDSPLEPALLEASFGAVEESEREALELGGWGLHGYIDRIDVGPAGGVVYDYKLSRETTPHAKFVAEGKLQLPLYMLAARELWGIEPIAGLYQPLRPTKDPRPRGLARADQREGVLESLDVVDTDWLEPEEFERLLAETRARATAIVERMRHGDITRDPIDNKCPPYCTFAPICRRERGEVAAPEEDTENGDEST